MVQQTTRGRGHPDPDTTDADRPGLAESLHVSLLLAGRAMKARLEAEGEEVADFFLLRLVDRAGSMRGTALAAAAGLDHSTVSRHVGRLVDAGLLVRDADPADRRAGLLRLSAAGRRAMERARQRRSAMLARATADWPERDLRRLTDLLTRLGDDLDRPRADGSGSTINRSSTKESA